MKKPDITAKGWSTEWAEGLREELRRLQHYLDIAGVILVVIGLDETVVLINRKGCQVLGRSEHEVVGKNWFDNFIPESGRVYVRSVFAELVEGEAEPPETVENPVLCSDGKERIVAWHNRLLRDPSGRPIATLSSGEDITERVRAERSLKVQNDFLQKLLDTIPVPVFYKDTAGVYRGCNRAFEEFLHLTKKEIVGKKARDVVQEETAYVYNRKDDELFRSPGVQVYETSTRLADGTTREIVFHKATYTGLDGEVAGLIGVMLDVTERRRMIDELRILSNTDQLTDLNNRRGFFMLAEQQIRLAERMKQRFSIFFVDIDDMKWINDTLGHTYGDRALTETADVLRETFRESDIIGRIGGDEFAVLAIDVTERNVQGVTNRLEESLGRLNSGEGREYGLSLSLGVSHYDPGRPLPLNELMSRADTMMYEQKRRRQQSPANRGNGNHRG